MKKKLTRILLFVTVLFLAFLFNTDLPGNQLDTMISVQAASVKLNKKKATIKTGSSLKLKVSGTKKKTKWKTSNRAVATVNKKGKVTGKKPGKAVITAKIGSKKLKCKVTVKAGNQATNPSPSPAGKRYSGSSEQYGIRCKVEITADKDITINLTNNNDYPVSLGWVNMSQFVFQSSKGTTYVDIDTLSSIRNSGINYQRINPGDTAIYTGNIKNVTGDIRNMSITNIYPLNSNGLPQFDYGSFSDIIYTLNVALK